MYYSKNLEKLETERNYLKQKVALYESIDPIKAINDLCDKKIQAAYEREKKYYRGWMGALDENKRIKQDNTDLRKELGASKKENVRLVRSNEKLSGINENLSQECQRVKDKAVQDKVAYEAALAEKDAQIEALKETILSLNAKLTRDGTDTSIPTSQTPIDKNKVIPNTRIKTGRKPGGQPGHQKHTLLPISDDEVTQQVVHTLDSCPVCGSTLEAADGSVNKDVYDYEVKIVKVRHTFQEYWCKTCGCIVRDKIPCELKEAVQYGPNIQALALSLIDMGFVSISRTQQMVIGILNNTICPSEGYIGTIQKKASRLLQNFYKEAHDLCCTQNILYWDDTVIFIDTKRGCFRFYGNEHVAYYAAHKAKDAIGIEEDNILQVLGNDTRLMHDHVKYNYRNEFQFQNLECSQHLERELQRVYNESAHTWAKDAHDFISSTIHKRKEHLRNGVICFTKKELDNIENELDDILKRAHQQSNQDKSRYFSNDERLAIQKIEEFRENYFAWVYDFSLPTTNNLSEASLRMVKTKQKVSGQFLKVETAQEFAVVRTYTETCKRNGVPEYDALQRLMSGNPYSIKKLLGVDSSV